MELTDDTLPGDHSRADDIVELEQNIEELDSEDVKGVSGPSEDDRIAIFSEFWLKMSQNS